VTAALYPYKVLVQISDRGWVNPMAMERHEGLSKLKKFMTSSELEPATLWLVT
jgi:hypothetical protein